MKSYLIIPVFALLVPFTTHAMALANDASAKAQAKLPGATATVSVGASSTVNATSAAQAATDVHLLMQAQQQGTSATGTDAAQAHASATAKLVANARGAIITSPAEVQNEADLAVYVTNVPKMHAEVASADAANGHLSVSYNHSGYLFGVIPVTIVSKTTVSGGADGTVQATTAYPWWHVLVSGVSLDEATSVDSSITKSADVSAAFSANASAQAKAQAVADIVAELYAGAGAQANAQASAQ